VPYWNVKDMRLDAVYLELLNDQLDYYDRMYTLSSGPENGWSRPLHEARRDFIDRRFPILQSPFVEGIPRYHKDETWSWDHLYEELEGEEKEEMKIISALLSSYAKWSPYPHQIESIREWQKGKHIVVATGTGSGKTECFLYPMLGQLVREARRAKARGKPMERGVKAIVLYPMNALVADQTVRIRDLFGQLDMANKLMHEGAGRYCQFGMYTGRTPAHGWYSERSASGNWNYKKNGPRAKVRNITKAYTELEEHHPELWERLVNDRRIPAKGGHWRATEDGTWGHEDVLGQVSGTGTSLEAVDDWSLKAFAEGLSDMGQTISHVGQPGDRELYARYEMHMGGLIQRAINSSNPTEDERTIFEEQTSHLGVPDILVTNYSMLEYTLLRPLEHVFWEDTMNWLYGTVEDDEPPRKLLLVLDEAHLYQGSMGTEVSMLIQRLTSVLSRDDKTPEIQVVITSASLGDSDDLKQEFVADLTGINAADVVVPTPARTDLMESRSWDQLTVLSEEVINLLQNVRPSQEEIGVHEYEFYSKLEIEEDIQRVLTRLHNEGGTNSEIQQLRFAILEHQDLFIRLYTALQHPNLLDETLHAWRPNGEKSAPWSLDNLSMVVFNQVNRKSLSVFLDLVAMSRDTNGIPLMPVRGHFFSRGMPRLSICPRCSSFHNLETLRCEEIVDGHTCNARTYELLYGRSTGVAFLNLWLTRTDAGDELQGLRVQTGRQMAYSGPNDGGGTERRVGLAAWRCMPNKPHTHILDMVKGVIIPQNSFDREQFDTLRHACLKISGFSGGGFDENLLWKDKHGKTPQEFFDKVCPESGRDHSKRHARQVSNLQTRGNEAFSALVDGLLQNQDPVIGSANLPNKGKKCLIFSDSRQQAANVAVELGQLSNHDETRRLLLEMISKDWFKALPSMHKNLSGMYPWFALYSSSKGLNPFCGGEYIEDRSLFVAAGVNAMASLLASRVVEFSDDEVRFSEHKQEVEVLINSVKPSYCDDFSFSDIPFKAKKRTLSTLLNSELPHNQRLNRMEQAKRDHVELWIHKLKETESMEHLESLPEKFSDVAGDEPWGELRGQLQEVVSAFSEKLNQPIQYELFEGSFQHIVDITVGSQQDSWRLTPAKLGKLCDQTLSLVSTTDILRRGGFINQWNRTRGLDHYIPIHQKEMGKYSEGWAQFITKIVNDGEYGLEEIGLGYTRINDIFWDKINSELRNSLPMVRYLLPRIFSRSFKKANVRGASILSNALFSESRMPGFNPLAINKNNPFNGDPPGLTELPEFINKIKQLIRNQGDYSTFEVEELVTELNSNSFFTTAGGRIGMNADAVEIVPVLEGAIRICGHCYRPRLTPEEDTTNCGACGRNHFLSSDSDEFTLRYRGLRIDPWRTKISNLLEDANEEVFLVRAQEHTAQIGDKLDDSDLYSPAELYELQFQDMPVPDSASVLGERSSLPPIDVLSCTTTMEVGIDIGSLTCVALRSMPPHSANYQQRIGRAGRGSAEVSIALTWADNSAYAQQLFQKPERLLHHPDTPPKLYMENERIMRRHFQASLLQLFMKRKPYIRDLLVFEGMQESDGAITPSMVESLGLVEKFFATGDHEYGFGQFCVWIREKVDDAFLQQHFGSIHSSSELLRTWVIDFVSNLQSYQGRGE
jgi:Lhr-like helicase